MLLYGATICVDYFLLYNSLVMKVTLVFSIIAAGYMDSRCLSIAAFLKEIDSFI